MVFTLRSKSVQHLHITPYGFNLGFPGVHLGFLALLGFGCHISPLMVTFYDYY
jgi:hypothetical protein